MGPQSGGIVNRVSKLVTRETKMAFVGGGNGPQGPRRFDKVSSFSSQTIPKELTFVFLPAK